MLSDMEYRLFSTSKSVEDILLSSNSYPNNGVMCHPAKRESCWLELSMKEAWQREQSVILKSLSSREGVIYFIHGQRIGKQYHFEQYRALNLNKYEQFDKVLISFDVGKSVNVSAIFMSDYALKNKLIVNHGVVLAITLFIFAVSIFYVLNVWRVKKFQTIYIFLYSASFLLFYIYNFGFIWDGVDNVGVYIHRFFVSKYWYSAYTVALTGLYLMVVNASGSKANYGHFAICSGLFALQFLILYLSLFPIYLVLNNTFLAALSLYTLLHEKSIKHKRYILFCFAVCFLSSYLVVETSLSQSKLTDFYYEIQLFFFISHMLLVLICIYELSELRVVNFGDYRRLKSSSTQDFMTGLSNRKAINYKSKLSGSMCFYYIDADKLKFTNDTQGHHVGDRMLINLSKRIGSIASECEGEVYRVGGDEFVLISTQSASLLLIQAQQEVSADINVEQCFQFSFGRYRSEPGEMVEDSIYKAEYCCRKAKQLKRHLQDWCDQDELMLYSLPSLREEAVKLIESERLVCFAQKIASLSGKEQRYELLCRLEREAGSNQYHAAGQVLDIVASHGLEKELDIKMMMFAGRFLDEHKGVLLNLNFSVKTLFEPHVLDLLAKFEPASLQRLTIEVTEQVFYRADSRFKNIVGEMRELGVSIALDDFGSGYSSYSILSEVTFDMIKIDGSLIKDIHASPFKRHMVKSLVELASMNGSILVAERIEKPAELEALTQLGITHVQGYLLHKPGLASLEFEVLKSAEQRVSNISQPLLC
jgi:diguanylate cyclase (GGDEF)-like protein